MYRKGSFKNLYLSSVECLGQYEKESDKTQLEEKNIVEERANSDVDSKINMNLCHKT
jgi:hypothetical protein